MDPAPPLPLQKTNTNTITITNTNTTSNSLNEHGSSPAASVAQGGHPKLAWLQVQSQVICYPGSRHPKWMTQGYRSTMNVDHISADVQNLTIGNNHNGKCLVDLPESNVRRSHSMPIQHLFDPKSVSDRPVHRLDCSISVTHDPSQRLQAQLRNHGCGGKHRSSSAISQLT